MMLKQSPKFPCSTDQLCTTDQNINLRKGVMKMQQTEQTEQVEQSEGEVRNDPAFEVVEINLATGETTIIIKKGIVGAMANQLKNTSNRRKGSSILRKLGYVLSDCGDIQYGGEVNKTDIDPDLVTNEDEVSNPALE